MALIKPFRTIPNIARKSLNHDLVDYIWYTNYFDDVEIAKIKALWDDNQVVEARVNDEGNKAKRDDIRKSSVMFIRPEGNEWIYNKLADACLQINTKRFKFDINGFQTELQLAQYGEGDFFEWHMDYGTGDVSNRKLSITVQLSDPDEYDGGDLQFLINQNAFSAPRTKGTAIIFPSYMVHRVLPITSGKRMSIVGWIAGTLPYR